MTRLLKYSEAVNEAISQSMAENESVICYGLGATDPKAIFGTTGGLEEKFGSSRVFDMPTSENAMTGIAIGASLNGSIPIMTHQRLDFFLLALDQLINNAAKWFYTFDGQDSVPITIRLILGRGWGQGPTHSQNLQSWFSHIPGLKVVMPTTAHDAKGLLLSSIFDPNPVVFLEHRWLHNNVSDVPTDAYQLPLGKAENVSSGNDLTIVSMSYMTIEALHAIEFLKDLGISCDIIDLRSINPIDWPTIYDSVRKTGRLLALDTGSLTGSVASEIVASVTANCFDSLKQAPERIALPDIPSPTSRALAEAYYPDVNTILDKIESMLGIAIPQRRERTVPSDVPGDWFQGPF